MSDIQHKSAQTWLHEETKPHTATSRVRVLDRPITDAEIPFTYESLTNKLAAAIIVDSPNRSDIIAAQDHLNPKRWYKANRPLSHSHVQISDDLNELGGSIPNYFNSISMPDQISALVQREYAHMRRFAEDHNHQEAKNNYRFLTLHSKENCQRPGRATNWHPDSFVTLSVYAHFTGAAVEWLPPDLDHEIYYDEEELDKHIQTLSPGQVLIDAGGLTHRSSQHIPERGQLSATLYYSPDK